MRFVLLGIAVACYQILIDRRIALYDVPLSALTTLSLSSVYAFIVWIWTCDLNLVIVVMIVAIVTIPCTIEELKFEFEELYRKTEVPGVRTRVQMVLLSAEKKTQSR